jgi:hypothetical protein
MQNKKTAVFGIFTTIASADNATDSLVKSGFSASDISALLPENLGNKAIGTEKSTKAPEGATAGAGTGAVLGGALGLLAGIGFGWRRSWRRGRRLHRCADRPGNSRVRS